MKIALEKTDRGFLRGEFTDRYGEPCSIQESSIATEECIWLGRDIEASPGARMHLTREMAAELIHHLQKFVLSGGLA